MNDKQYKKVYDLNAWSFKLFGIIPGLFTIILVTSPIWASLLGAVQILLYYITFLAVYWVFKSMMTSVGSLVALSRVKRATQTDWNEKIQKLQWKSDLSEDYLPSSYNDFYHAILIPFYKEDYEGVIKKTIQALADSEYDCVNKVFLVLGVEENGGEQALETVKNIHRDFDGKFKAIKAYVHPKDIPGEVKGIAGANLRFAAQSFVKEIKEEGYAIENFLVTKFDCDLRVHPKFLSALSYKYITTQDRYHCFYSPAAMLYSNNYWDVPVLMRVIASALTLALLSEWVTDKRTKQSFSCYSFSLHLLDKIDYWDPKIGVDDTSFYWNAYLNLDGHFHGEEIYVPTYSDAVEANSTMRTHVAQYKQLHRWGWGVIVFPMTVQGLFRNKRIPFFEKISGILNLIHVYSVLLTIAFLITFGIPIISLLNRDFSSLGIAHVLPQVISILLTVSLVGLFPSRFVLYNLYGPPPKRRGLLFFYWHFFELLLLTLTMFPFHLFPYMQAQIEMMIGRTKKEHMVTPKKSDIV